MQEMVTDLRLATDLSLFSKVLNGRKCLFETHNTAEDGKGEMREATGELGVLRNF